VTSDAGKYPPVKYLQRCEKRRCGTSAWSFTTHSDAHPKVNERTSGVYLRADPEDMNTLDGRDDQQRAALITEQLQRWKSITNA
jgi:hypothetical protein